MENKINGIENMSVSIGILNKELKLIKSRLEYLRKQAYKKEGSYEESYNYLMNGIDKIIGKIKC